jgi:FK506-binding protein 4/5
MMDSIDISGDGQLTKQILVTGSGEEMPTSGSQVEVHYVGTLLDGTEFDSSRGRGTPFSFKLGQGQVIKGWDEGVATMKMGEKAILTCAPEYAYGAAGSPPKIPANATLQFEVELLSWNDKEDITKDGGVLKRVLKAGSGYQKPRTRSTVKVMMKATLEDETIFMNHMDQPLEMVLGDDESVPEGLEKAIESMTLGEKSQFFVKPNYGYGEFGYPELKVPSNASLVYELELVSFEKGKESWEMEKAEKIEYAQLLKDQGNRLFKQGRIARATVKYNEAVELIKFETTLEGELMEQANQVRLSCHLNMAACKLKMKNWTECIHACDEALTIASQSIKAMYRKAQAQLALGDIENARTTVEDALQFEPENTNMQVLQRKVRLAQQHIRAKERQVFGGIFSKKVTPLPSHDRVEETM